MHVASAPKAVKLPLPRRMHRLRGLVAAAGPRPKSMQPIKMRSVASAPLGRRGSPAPPWCSAGEANLRSKSMEHRHGNMERSKLRSQREAALRTLNAEARRHDMSASPE